MDWKAEAARLREAATQDVSDLDFSLAVERAVSCVGGAALSQHLEVSRPTIERWLRGSAAPHSLGRGRVLLQIAELLEQEPAPRHIDWDHIYGLAWWGTEGQAYLSTWMGDYPTVFCMVKGLKEGESMPLWTAKVPDGLTIHAMPQDLALQDSVAWCRERGGNLLLGWYCEAGVGERGQPRHDPVWG